MGRGNGFTMRDSKTSISHRRKRLDRGGQLETLDFTNEVERQAHQQEILRLNEEINDLISDRHTAHHGCFNNVQCFIKKNIKEVHRYYVIRCQYRQLEKHKGWLRLCYPNMEVSDECDDPNAIHRWCRFNREVIKKPNYYKNHFSLTEEKQALLETALDVNIYVDYVDYVDYLSQTTKYHGKNTY